ncbi:MAG: hypothetical protein ACRDNO_03335 [Trebonia sp.]
MASRPLTLRLAVLVVAAAATALGAWLGAWWVPFLVGLAVGALGRARARAGDAAPARGGVLAAVAGAILGWAVPLWALALDGQPVGATARVIAGLAGLPPYAWVTVTVVLLLAALQVLAGAWLARGAIPRRAPEDEAQETPDVNIGQV